MTVTGSPALGAEKCEASLAQWMTRGGDARIVLDPVTGLNRYYSTPFPRDVLAFASSTANDLGPDAMNHIARRFADGAEPLEQGPQYAILLDQLRDEIRLNYNLPSDIDVFFAPSGTDLEYVGLLAVAGRRKNGVANFLLGADEVGSGCIHSAAGCFFANETALGIAVAPGQPIAGLPPIEMGDLPVRCDVGQAHDSTSLAAVMELRIADALARDCFPLVHIVHGSKTGLVLPQLDDVDRLLTHFGSNVAFVVDACQARITDDAIREYLARGIIVFITGSKFMGGPPFSGFALLPSGFAANASPIAAGMADIFRRAEIPRAWPGRTVCSDTGNAGLALRLAASLFELHRFQKLSLDRITRVVSAFTAATDGLATDLDVDKVASSPVHDTANPAEHPIEMLTLVTLDLNHSDGTQRRTLDFETARRIHLALVDEGIRLGQPVRCVKLENGEWGATLRIGLSMPQVTMLDGLSDAAMTAWLNRSMDRIAKALAPMLAD